MRTALFNVAQVQSLACLTTLLSPSQRDSAGLATQNNELKFRLQAMEQQAQLRDGEKQKTIPLSWVG